MPESALIVKCNIQSPEHIFIFNSSIAFLRTRRQLSILPGVSAC
jgi:hypothetical protein